MRTISLDQLTVMGVRPAELVDIAAQAGFGAISPMMGLSRGSDLPVVPLRAGDPDTLAMARALKDSGVFINNADGFTLSAGTVMDDLRAAVDLMAEMGARGLVTLVFDSDRARAFDNYCQLRDWAQAAGLTLLLEFTALSQIGSLREALAWIDRAGGDNLAVLVDLMHLNRSGETPADVAALAPGVVRGAQLCDGRREVTAEEYLDQAMNERMVPGEGEYPVVEFLAALPRDLVIGLEIPLRQHIAAGESHLDRARRVLAATRAALAQAGAE